MTDLESKLTPEQMEKARACKKPEELIELAKAEGYEIADEELQSIAGGSWNSYCWNETW